MTRPNTPNSVKVIQVIETRATRGYGIEKDPAREVVQYWDLEGNFLAERDMEHMLPVVEYDTECAQHDIDLIKNAVSSEEGN